MTFVSYTKCRNIATTAVKYAKFLFETQLAKKTSRKILYTLFW